jgi:hypothetical protein
MGSRQRRRAVPPPDLKTVQLRSKISRSSVPIGGVNSPRIVKGEPIRHDVTVPGIRYAV